MVTFLNVALIVAFVLFAVLTFGVIIGIALKKDNNKIEEVENKQ